ncbi:hypothetical protein [Roseibium alexandrii]|uniref:Uncharacterized protein n=1 Tax=Roseibium alexandrii TaxID=388408 RepID=A0A0M7A7A4_9HYPH|nr:hypothetical protein [Roseibium alexandrii]CTQ70968.1 hypothetical protein LAX5112_02670 [Roseibium alexandrii]
MVRKPSPAAPADAGDPTASAQGAKGAPATAAADTPPQKAGPSDRTSGQAAAAVQTASSAPSGEAGSAGQQNAAPGSATGADTGAGSGSGRGSSGGSDLLKEILEGFLKTSTLQSDYQSLYRSLPTVVGIAAEILKKKEAGDAALDEGMQAVERVLTDARDKAEQLSNTMSAQQADLEKLLNDKASLTELLKASQQKKGEAFQGMPQFGPGTAALADPKVAYQLNTLMGNINSMVAREVERQIAGLRSQANAAPQHNRPKS